jgi:hypothetical protein
MTTPDTPTPPPADDEQLAADAYQAYGDSVEWQAHTGLSMPLWANLPTRQRDAWAHAARRVRMRVQGGPR